MTTQRKHYDIFSLTPEHKEIMLETMKESVRPISRENITEALLSHLRVTAPVPPEIRTAIKVQVTRELKNLRSEGKIFMCGSGSNPAFIINRKLFTHWVEAPVKVKRKHNNMLVSRKQII